MFRFLSNHKKKIHSVVLNTIILSSQDHSKAVMNIIFKMVTIESTTFTNLITMLIRFSNGHLKKQKLKPSEIVNGAVMPFTFADLSNVATEAAKILLNDLTG